MGRVLTNNTGFIYGIEPSLGANPTSWKQLEPNSINQYGATITTVARNPISKRRQRRKGTTTDLDSAVEFEADITLDAVLDFIEGFVFATAWNGDMTIPVSAAETTGDSYTVAALTAAQANKLEFSAGEYATLIFGRGFTSSGNNGLKELDTDVAAAATSVPVSGNLTDEASPPANARIEIAGLRSLAAAADLTWNYDAVSETATLASAADITDFSVWLIAGQLVHIGSPDGSGGVTNAFQNSSANDMYGYARVRSFAAGEVVFDKLDDALKFDDTTAPATAVDILFGQFIRNVAVDNADYLERSFQFEAAWENLQNPGPGDEYEYSKGNYCNQVQFNLALADKATMTLGFVGTDTDAPTSTRKSGASAASASLGTGAFNTSADIARLRIQQVDDTGITTDFKSLTLTLNNNVSPEKVLGQLGAKYINTGNFEVDAESQLLFTNSAVPAAIRANETLMMDFVLKNDDGAIAFDIPSMTLGGGDKELPVNESVLINTTGQAFEDATLGTSIGVSIFPIVP